MCSLVGWGQCTAINHLQLLSKSVSRVCVKTPGLHFQMPDPGSLPCSEGASDTFEFGEFKEQGQRSDLQEVTKQITDGGITRLRDIPPALYVRMDRGLEKLVNLHAKPSDLGWVSWVCTVSCGSAYSGSGPRTTNSPMPCVAG